VRVLYRQYREYGEDLAYRQYREYREDREDREDCTDWHSQKDSTGELYSGGTQGGARGTRCVLGWHTGWYSVSTRGYLRRVVLGEYSGVPTQGGARGTR